MNHKLYLQIILFPVLLIILTAIIITAFNIREFQQHAHMHIEETTSAFVEQKKAEVREKVEQALTITRFRHAHSEGMLKREIKSQVDHLTTLMLIHHENHQNPHNLLNRRQYHNLLKQELLGLLAGAPFDDPSGFFLVIDRDTNRVLHHQRDELIGQDISDHRNTPGLGIDAAKEAIAEGWGSGFQRLPLLKPADPEGYSSHIFYFRTFETSEFNWLIGVSSAIDAAEAQQQRAVIEELHAHDRDQRTYLFVIDLHNIHGGEGFGTVLMSKNTSILGQRIDDDWQDAKGKYHRRDYLKLLREQGQGFLEYWYLQPNGEGQGRKISYFFHYEPWNWAIASGFYFYDLDQEIARIHQATDDEVTERLRQALGVSLVLITLAVALALLFARNTNRRIRLYSDRIEELNQNLNQRVADKTSALKESQLRLSAIIEQTPDPIFLVDVDSARITNLNPALGELLGYSQDELKDMPLTQFDAEETPEENRERIAAIQRQGRAQFTRPWRTKTGALLQQEIHVSTIELGGKPVFLCITRDVTARLRMESALVEAKERAESANRAKSAFLANMSHELRTPLNAVLGYAQILLQDKTLDAEQRRSLEAIRHGGDYLLLLINDILDLAKIEADRFELFPSPTDPVSLFEQIAEQFAFRTRQKGIDFVMEGLDDLPAALEADDKRLRQVVMNLLGNAVKFTEQGEVHLSLAHHDDSLFVRVSDTGIGIPKDRVEHLFTPYTQEGAEVYKRQGTGLGLAICKALVERMGGSIEVSSEVGRGSRFAFSIPAPCALPGAVSTTPRPGLHRMEGYHRSDNRQHPLLILVTDDLASNRLVLAGLLQPLGFEVMQADGGEASIAACRQQRPDLVLMDLVMPDIDGLTATRQLRREHPDLPVIAVSAHAYAEDRANSRAAGCADHLAKPVQRDELLAVLQDHLPLVWHRPPEDTADAAGHDTTTPLEQPPPEALAALKEALLIGRRRRMTAALETIAETAPRLAEQLHQAIERYDYDSVTKLIHDLLSDT